MNAFELEGIERAGAVTHEDDAVSVRARHRPPAALGNRLCAIADHLAALEEPLYAGMQFEFLEFGVRFELRILVVETDDEPDIPNVAGHRVDESAAERLVGERLAQRVG